MAKVDVKDEPKEEKTSEKVDENQPKVAQVGVHVEEHLDRDPNDPRNREYAGGESHSLNDHKMGGLGEEDK